MEKVFGDTEEKSEDGCSCELEVDVRVDPEVCPAVYHGKE